MNISLAITTYNRYDLTIKSCSQVLDDPRIDDIVILDDCSTDGSFEKLVEHFKPWPHVRVLRQAKNRGMSLNKADAIGYAKNEWVMILDSDNVVTPAYFDAFFRSEEKLDLNPIRIYCPDFAAPNFNYRRIAGQFVGYESVSRQLRSRDGDIYNTCLNTCNYIVHAEEYLRVYRYNPEMKATDTAWFAYLWLQAGNDFYVVPGMEYEHLVHGKSGFLEDANYNMAQADKLKKMMMAL